MSYSICQRCRNEHTESWNIEEAELHIGRILHWKVQLCPPCTNIVEQSIRGALKPEKRTDDRS